MRFALQFCGLVVSTSAMSQEANKDFCELIDKPRVDSQRTLASYKEKLLEDYTSRNGERLQTFESTFTLPGANHCNVSEVTLETGAVSRRFACSWSASTYDDAVAQYKTLVSGVRRCYPSAKVEVEDENADYKTTSLQHSQRQAGKYVERSYSEVSLMRSELSGASLSFTTGVGHSDSKR